MSEQGDTRSTGLVDRLVEPSDWRLGWSPQLDGLRGIATLLVMSIHYTSSFKIDRPDGSSVALLEGFSITVDLFFALSGFLITSLLFAELDKRRTIGLKRFYIRRAIRLFPALYAFLAIFVVFTIVFVGDERRQYLTEAGAVFLYVYNFFIAWVGVEGNALIQLWTLAIEQQFYVVWPPILLLAVRRRLKAQSEGLHSIGQGSDRPVWLLFGAMVGFIIVLPLLRMMLPEEMGARTAESFLFGLSIMRPDAVVLGCMAAFAMRVWSDRSDLKREANLSRMGHLALVIVLAICILGPLPAFTRYVSLPYNIAVVAAAVLVFDLVRFPDKPVARLLRTRPIVWIGERSYALYVWHLLVYFVIKGVIEGMLPGRTRVVDIVTLPFAYGLTILISAGSWKFIEEPALKLKKRFAG